MFAVAAAGILVSMALLLARAFLGPTVYDRILAANTFGTKTVVLLAVIGFMTGRPDWIDLSLIYSLINFIGTIAALKLFEFGTLAHTRGRDHE